MRKHSIATFDPGSFHLHAWRALRVGFLAGLVGGCAPGAEDAAPRELVDRADDLSIGTRYVDLASALPAESDRQRWRAIQSDLERAFDDVCGDTFCEGDWSNLEPLGLACSASAKRGDVRECAWSFGASEERIDPASGSVAASVPLFVCRFRPTGTAKALVATLHEDPLRAELPGLGASAYDLLGDCFDAPEGATQLGGALDGPFVDAAELLADDAAFEAWYGMRDALSRSYAEMTEGDDDAPHALRFRCSEDQSTARLGSCAWSFVGAALILRRDGTHRVAAKRRVCSFSPDATASELAEALGPHAEGAPPLDRPIPGVDATLREILEGCFRAE